MQRGNVVLERLLHPDALGREQQHPLEPLLIHQFETGRSVPVAGVVRQRVELAEHLAEVHPAVDVLATEVVLEAPGFGHRVEGGVRDELVDPAADQEPPLAVDLGPLHAALLHLRIDVPDEGVLGLVVVVVGVEREEGKLAHLQSVGRT
ncbi:MAG: hypothetical protein R2695_21105 [Acidimicrobiales bacterium]